MSDVLPSATADKIIAEKIRVWEENRKKQKEQTKQDSIKVHPFLGIVRDFGCGEEAIIPLLEQTLGWKVYGKSLLDHIAERDSLSRNFIETLDEHKQGLLDNWVNFLIRSGAILQDDYVIKVSRLMKTIIAQESAVILGRGVNYILDDKKEGLRIKLTAHFEHRVKHISGLRKIPEDEAEKLVKQIDADRKHFHEKYFEKKYATSIGFDISFNTRTLSPETICKTVAMALEEKKAAE